jgi:hypothetical protein
VSIEKKQETNSGHQKVPSNELALAIFRRGLAGLAYEYEKRCEHSFNKNDRDEETCIIGEIVRLIGRIRPRFVKQLLVAASEVQLSPSVTRHLPRLIRQAEKMTDPAYNGDANYHRIWGMLVHQVENAKPGLKKRLLVAARREEIPDTRPVQSYSE